MGRNENFKRNFKSNLFLNFTHVALCTFKELLVCIDFLSMMTGEGVLPSRT